MRNSRLMFVLISRTTALAFTIQFLTPKIFQFYLHKNSTLRLNLFRNKNLINDIAYRHQVLQLQQDVDHYSSDFQNGNN
jgi:hypothetical protein